MVGYVGRQKSVEVGRSGLEVKLGRIFLEIIISVKTSGNLYLNILKITKSSPFHYCEIS